MDSIEGLATFYIRGIRKHQAKGPYRIAGYSFGSILALEIAQQLQARGEEVENLFLLDPYLPYRAELPASGVPGGIKPYVNDCNRIDNKLKRNLVRARDKYRTNGLRGLLSFIVPRLEQIPGGYWLVYQLFHLHIRYPNRVAEALVSRKLWPVFWYSARRKLALYTAKPYSGRSLIVFTPGQGGDAIWSRLLGESVLMRTVDMEHLKVFAENSVSLWMQVLNDALSNEQENHKSPPD
jgi:pimeloyl-ACP methyl ester carboxylesterase